MSLYINGEWLEGAGATFTSTDPSSDTVIWKGREATADQVNAAVDA